MDNSGCEVVPHEVGNDIGEHGQRESIKIGFVCQQSVINNLLSLSTCESIEI